MEESNNVTIEENYKGVGGWLLLFCIGLTILNPLVTIYTLYSSYDTLGTYFNRIPNLLNLTIIDDVLSIGIVILSIYAGISLWKIRINAVKIAKIYLIVYLCYSVLIIFLPYLARMESSTADLMSKAIAKECYKSVIYFIIWFPYLYTSKRIKANFSTFNKCPKCGAYLSPGWLFCPKCKENVEYLQSQENVISSPQNIEEATSMETSFKTEAETSTSPGIENYMGNTGQNGTKHTEIIDSKKYIVLAFIVICYGTDRGKSFDVYKEKTYIGRNSGEILLDDSTVSDKHALIFRENEKFMIWDLDSSNGTFVNNVKVDNNPVELKDNDIIRIGATDLKFKRAW